MRDLRNPIVIGNRGKPIAALVPIDDIDLETLSLGTNPQFLDILERSRRRLESEGGISTDEMRRRVGVPKKGSSKKASARHRKSKAVLLKVRK